MEKKQLISTALAAARKDDAGTFNRCVSEVFELPLGRYYENFADASRIPLPPNTKRLDITIYPGKTMTARAVFCDEGGGTVEFYVHKKDVFNALTAVYIGVVLRAWFHYENDKTTTDGR